MKDSKEVNFLFWAKLCNENQYILYKAKTVDQLANK